MPFDSEIGLVKLHSPSAPRKPWRGTWTSPGLTRQVEDRETNAGAKKLAKEIKGQLKREVVAWFPAATRLADGFPPRTGYLEHFHRF